MGNQNVTGIPASNAMAGGYLEHDGEGSKQEKEEEDKTVSENSMVLIASKDEDYPEDGGGKDLPDESASLEQASEDEILMKKQTSQEDEERNPVPEPLPENKDANLIPSVDPEHEDEDEEEQNSIKCDDFSGGIIVEMARNVDALGSDATVDESESPASDRTREIAVLNSNQIMENNNIKSWKEESRSREDGVVMDTNELDENGEADRSSDDGTLVREKSSSTESIETIFMDAIETGLKSLLKEDDQRAIVGSSKNRDANEQGVIMNVISDEPEKAIVEGIKSDRIQVNTDAVSQGKEESLGFEQLLQESEIKSIETGEGKKQENNLISLAEEEDVEDKVATDRCKDEVQSASEFPFAINNPSETVIKGVVMEAIVRERTNDIFEKDMMKNKEERTEIVDDKDGDQIQEEKNDTDLVETNSQTLPAEELFKFNAVRADHELPDCSEETFQEEAEEKSEMMINEQELNSSSHASESLDACPQTPNLAEAKHSPPELDVIDQDHELFEFPVEIQHKETAQVSEVENNEEKSSSSNVSGYSNLVDKTHEPVKAGDDSCKKILIPMAEYEAKEQECSPVVHESAGTNLETSSQNNVGRMNLPLHVEKRGKDDLLISKKSSDQETPAVIAKSNNEELNQGPLTLEEKPKELSGHSLVKRSDSGKPVTLLRNLMEEECVKEPPEKKKGKRKSMSSSFFSCIFCTTAMT